MRKKITNRLLAIIVLLSISAITYAVSQQSQAASSKPIISLNSPVSFPVDI